MAQLTSDPIVLGQELFSSSATQAHDLGAKATDGKGRIFRYVKAGASNLVAGNTLQSPAEIADHYGCSVAAAAIGATSVTVTPGATGGAAGLYSAGWMCVDTTPGLGQMIPIKGHAAITASTAFTLLLELPLWVALTTSSKVTLVQNPRMNVIQAPITTLTGVVCGVCTYPINASEFGWIGTGGPHPTLCKGTTGPGLAVVVPGSVAGGVVIDGAASATPPIGQMMITSVDAKCLPVLWMLD